MAPDLTSDPIYQSLLALSRRAKLDAIAISGYAALLNCEEVLRRTGQDATQLERAECAEAIIRDFIAKHVPPKDRAILEASFGLTAESEGKSISVRHNELLVSNTTFNNTRRTHFEVLTRLFRSLPPPQPSSGGSDVQATATKGPVPMTSLIDRERQIALGYALGSLGRDALRVHFAAIGVLIESELADRLPLTPGSPTCQALLFDALREFRPAADYWSKVPRQVRETFYADPKRAQVDDVLIEALGEVKDFWPLRSGEDEGSDDSTIPYALALALEQGGPPNHDDLYWELWVPWMGQREPAEVESLCSHSGAVAAIVSLSAGHNAEAWDHLSQEVLLSLDRGFKDLWTEDQGAESFRAYLESSFDKRLHELLK